MPDMLLRIENGRAVVDVYGASLVAIQVAQARAARDAVRPLFGIGPPAANAGIAGSFYRDMTDPAAPLEWFKTDQGWQGPQGLKGNPGGTYDLVGTALEVSGIALGPAFGAFSTTGYRKSGDGGRAFYARVDKEPTHPGKLRLADRLLSDCVTVSAANGGWCELVYNVDICPEMFGAKRDDTADDYAPIQAALDYLRAKGGGVLNLRPGTYKTTQTIAMRKGVWVSGPGFGAIIHGTMENSNVLRYGYDGNTGGEMRLTDFSVKGSALEYLDANGRRTQYDEKVINCVGLDRMYIRGLNVTDGRSFGIGCWATLIEIYETTVKRMLRDAINGTGAYTFIANDNVIDASGDDAICAHVNGYMANGPYMPSAIACRNRISRAQGMKFLGARQVIANDNVFDRFYQQALFVDTEATEGRGTKFSIQFCNNICTNMVPNTLTGTAAVINKLVHIANFETRGSGNQSQGVLEGYSDGPGNYMLPPEPYLYFMGNADGVNGVNAYPVRPGRQIRISGNLAAQIFNDPVGAFSHYYTRNSRPATEDEMLWSVNGGFIDPASPGLKRTCQGVLLAGDFLGVDIFDNDLEGFTTLLRGQVNNRMRGVRVDRNRFRRGETLAVFETTTENALRDCDILISRNHVDIDPYCELQDHGQDNKWNVTDGSTGFVVWSIGVNGVRVEENDVRHVRRLIKENNGARIACRDNNLFWQWSVDGNGNLTRWGIGDAIFNAQTFLSSRHYFQYMNPIDVPSFLRFNTTPDSAFVTHSDQRPTSGRYAPGSFVASGLPWIGPQGGKRLLGWRRQTWTDTHTDADWTPEYAATA